MPESSSLYLKVALDTPVRGLFDYLPPEGLDRVPAPGVRVEVPFGRATRIGILAETATVSEVPVARPRRAVRVLDAEPLLDLPTRELVEFAAGYYQFPLGESYAAALPSLLRQGRNLSLTELRWRQAKPAGARLGERQRAVMDLLSQAPSFGEAQLAALGAPARAAARALVARGVLQTYEQPGSQPTEPVGAPLQGPPLNDGQAKAVASIGAGLGGDVPFLLHGITGSGKTEVYLRAIEQALARHTQALVSTGDRLDAAVDRALSESARCSPCGAALRDERR